MAARSEQETFIDSVLDATVDTILAFASVWVFLFSVATQTTALVGPPVPESTLHLAIGLVAFGTTYPFVTGLWPLKPWLDFLLTAGFIYLTIGLIGAVVLVSIGGIPTDSAASELLQFGLFAGSLVGAVAVSVVRNRSDTN